MLFCFKFLAGLASPRSKMRATSLSLIIDLPCIASTVGSGGASSVSLSRCMADSTSNVSSSEHR